MCSSFYRLEEIAVYPLWLGFFFLMEYSKLRGICGEQEFECNEYLHSNSQIYTILCLLLM